MPRAAVRPPAEGAAAAYIPHTAADVERMLAAVGCRRLEDLFASVPEALRVRAGLRLGAGLSEPEALAEFSALAAANPGAEAAVFLGAGFYPHFVPSVIEHLLQRVELETAYTPYQPEVSQGTLQATFEFQSLVAALFALEVANASVYDGASATAEAVLMAKRLLPGRRRVVVARSLHPQYRAVLRTYATGLEGLGLEEVGFGRDGRLDRAALAARLGEDVICVVAGQPNFFGVLEDLAATAALASAHGALLVTSTAEPLAFGIVRPPGRCGVAIAVGEGQSLGLPLSYGGPGVGLFATRERYLRQMPGRLVGETIDARGRRGYVLTLATREQHIRRERATSNICTNHGLCALAVAAYLSLLGPIGLRELAERNYRRAHAVASRLGGPAFTGPFFNEFVLRLPGAEARLARLRQQGVVAGLPLGPLYPELEDCLLTCVTEVHRAADIDRLVSGLGG